MQSRRWIMGVLVLGLAAGGAGVWWSTSGSANLPLAQPSDNAPETDDKPTAKAVVPVMEYDFGIVDPASEIAHDFVIRNEGEAPLELYRGQTSCKCTMSSFDEMAIPAGSAGVVAVGMKTKGKKDGPFTESATILTNDPENDVIQLRIVGRILQRIAASPERLVLGGSVRGEEKTVSTTVYSQVWDEFAIADVQATDPEFRWEIVEAEEKSLEALKARSGYKLVLHVPGKEEGGNYYESLNLSIRPPQESDATSEAAGEDAPAEVSLRIEVGRSVAGRFTLFGPKLDTENMLLKLGIVPSGETARAVLTMKLRDPERPLEVLGAECDVEFLEVSIQPYKPDQPELGLYRVEVGVPADAPICDYMAAGRQAEVHIKTDRTDVPELKFKVSFAVARP